MGTSTATVKGGFWPTNNVTSLSGYTRGYSKKRAAMYLSTRGQLVLREIMRTLTGAAPGTTATKTLSRVSNSETQGGKRTIITDTLVSRATTSADVTEIKNEVLSQATLGYNGSPVANKDGNPLGTR